MGGHAGGSTEPHVRRCEQHGPSGSSSVANNGAEAVGTAAEMTTKVAVTQPLMPSFTSMTTPSFVNTQSPDPTIAWLMAFGFLGLVIARRVRGE